MKLGSVSQPMGVVGPSNQGSPVEASLDDLRTALAVFLARETLTVLPQLLSPILSQLANIDPSQYLDKAKELLPDLNFGELLTSTHTREKRDLDCINEIDGFQGATPAQQDIAHRFLSAALESMREGDFNTATTQINNMKALLFVEGYSGLLRTTPTRDILGALELNVLYQH